MKVTTAKEEGSNKKEIDLILSEGSKKAEITATQVIKRVKTKLGF